MAKSSSDQTFLIVRFLAGLICFYQKFSALGIPHCRFYPSCSEYMREALITAGFWRGTSRGILRILKCHPWHPGGVDLVRSIRGE